MSILTHNEAIAYLRDGSLPENFAQRLQNQLEFDSCSNCGDVRCMHFVLRDWWNEDFDSCDRWCCPFCSDLKEYRLDVERGATGPHSHNAGGGA